jgi:type VI secretion system FHA domain protein
METLQARTELRNRFRISQETIQPAENNPFKFSAGVDEALRKLFEQQGNRYLGPVDSVRESLRDIRLHQQALLEAMHVAFKEFIHRLDPEELQDRFDRGLKRGGLLGATNKMKYWELYGELYNSITQMPHDTLPHVFVEDFARAYEARMVELSTRKPRSADAPDEEPHDATRVPVAKKR